MLWYDAGIDGDYAITPEVWRRIVEELTGLGAIGADRADGTGDAGQRALEPVRAAPIVVVMDDFDELAAPDLLTGVEYLVRVLKGRVRVVLSCRTVPPLPLHRWRVTGELGEVRADQLAFTLDETAELISAYKVGLADSSVAELHALTEGWPAGLRLAALAMRDHPEPEQVVAELGTDDGVASYLSREVLAALPPDTCRTMAEVSVVEQVTAAMVEALTGRRDGARMLAALDQQGAFVYRRPGPGEWYRFHPLLSRLLYSELRRQDPARAALAHRRAAQWYIAHGPPAEALRHLLVAEDWATARETMDQHWPDIAVGSRRRSLKEVAPTPPEAIHTEPGLALAFAAERLDAADPVQARRFLRMGGDDRDDPAADNRSRAPVLLALQLAEARLAGDLEQTVEVATRLMSVSSTNDAVGRTVPAARALGLIAMGGARLQLGDLAAAGDQLCDGLALARRADLSQAQISAGSQLAMWYAVRGRLHAAARISRETMKLAERLGLTRATDLGWVRLAMAEAHYQWDRLEDARRLTDEAADHASGDPQMFISAAVLQAKIRFSAGQLAEAHQALLAARKEVAGARVSRPARRSLSLVEAEMRLAGGDLPASRRLLSSWAEEEPLSPWAATVEAAILLAEGRAAAAAAAVAPYLADGGDGASLTWRAQAGILNALAGKALGDRDRVIRGLDVALDAAEEEGFRRMFVAAGHALSELINAVAPAMSVYRLVATDLARVPVAPGAAAPPYLTGMPAAQGNPCMGVAPVEPLTARELTVLRYLQGDLSNVEIASVLYLSVNTIKTHVKSIYRKLNAARRREAVRRARELRLL
ncbi:MAG: hypothetical protein AUI14_06110 [Actinobacteria bacterium 13_2_20CM_2_71_6]|nr:MAG: hypothetical protein AUI14_06110 [Actinobacteria bacterium 13_2_20CM_2_71_6]